MRKIAKKLMLSRETLHRLAADRLSAAAGGATLLSCFGRTCGTCPVTCMTCGDQDSCAVC